jgi:hypothetical protein
MTSVRSFLALVVVFMPASRHLPASPPESKAGEKPFSVILTLSEREYDPVKPSKDVLKCAVRNNLASAIDVPTGYDGQEVVLRSGELMGHSEITLHRSRRPQQVGGGFVEKPPDKEKPVRVEPGKEHVVFTLPLDAILIKNETPDREWYWSWPRRSGPPRSPIHRQREAGRGFLRECRFQADVTMGGKMVSSEVVVLKVKTDK